MGLSEPELRQRITGKLSLGLLPRGLPAHRWGGHGDQRACAGCDDPIGRADVEIEVEVPGHPSPLYFHLHCEAVWELEVRAAAEPPA